MNRLIPSIEEYHRRTDYAKAKSCHAIHPKAKTCPECQRESYYDETTPAYTCRQRRNLYVTRYLHCRVAVILDALKHIPFHKRQFLEKKSY